MNEITQFLVAHGGPVLFAIVFVDQAGLPLPSAPWLLAAGALSACGKMNAAVAIGASVMASLIADALWFCVGRRGRGPLLRMLLHRSLAPTFCVGLAKGIYGRGLVVAKFLPGVGMVVPALAGSLGLSVSKFLLYDSLSSFIYGSFYFIAGFVFHNQLEEFVTALNEIGFSVLLLLLVLVPAYLAFKYVREWPISTARPPQSSTRKAEHPRMYEDTCHVSQWKHRSEDSS